MDTGDYSRGIALAGGRLFTAEDRDGMGVWDVSDPVKPKLVNRVAVPGQVRAIRIREGVAYVALGTAGLGAISIEPGKPPGLVTVAKTSDTARGVALLGTRYVVVADGTAGIKVFDGQDPGKLVFVSEVRGVEGSANRIAVEGTRAFVAYDYAGLRVFDLADPASPELVQGGRR